MFAQKGGTVRRTAVAGTLLCKHRRAVHRCIVHRRTGTAVERFRRTALLPLNNCTKPLGHGHGVPKIAEETANTNYLLT